jgi:hypothetical protein
MELSVSNGLPEIIAALLREDREASLAITEAYDRLIHDKSLNDATRTQLRADIEHLKGERNMTEARLCGWWRAVLIENRFDWETMTGTNGVRP